MARKKMISEEVLIQQNLENRLREFRNNYHISEPTIFYQVGDRVQRGHVKQTIITEVIDGGKIYKVHENYTDNNYGNQRDYERDDYVIWYDIDPYQTNEQIRNITKISKRDELQVTYSNRDIFGLFTTYYHFGIDMNPDYQRGNVWNIDDKVKLIDSIFNNVDIGKFVLIHCPYSHDGESYEILDGKQRITALVEFKEGRFEYKGKKYRDMHPHDRGHFDSYSIAWGDAIMSNGSKEVPKKYKYLYFLKLNTGGKPQDPEHIKYVQKLYDEAI